MQDAVRQYRLSQMVACVQEIMQLLEAAKDGNQVTWGTGVCSAS